MGLGLVERGVAKLDAKDREAAEGAFRTAVDLAPGLPDGHSGLAVALLSKGLLEVVPSIDAEVSGLSAFLTTGRGHRSGRDLATVAALLLAFAVAWTFAVALVVRHGGLLRHDLEEWLGPAQDRSASLALFLLVLLLPVATFQGWGWLPLWWLALVFAYLDLREKVLVGVLLAAMIAVGPAVASLELRLRTARNPLFHAALAAVESAPDRAAIARLEAAARSDPEDRDLAYLLGAARKRAGRYEEAAEGYRQMLAADPRDAVARNNLANIEFLRGSYDAARASVPGGHGAGGAARDRGHLVLQPVARVPAEVRVPGLQRGQAERGPARSRPGGRLRPVEVRLTRLRGRGPRPDARAGSGQVRGRPVGGRGAEHPRGARGARAGRAARALLREPLRGVRRGLCPRRLPRGAVARAEGVHPPLRPVRDGLLPLLPPRAGERGALLAVLPPVRGARRGVGPRAQPEDGGGAGSRGPPRAHLPGPLRPLPGRGAGLRRLDAPRSGPGPGVVRRARGPGGTGDRALRGGVAPPVASVARAPGRHSSSSGSGWPRTASARCRTWSCPRGRAERAGRGPRRPLG